MTFIKTIPEDQASGLLAELYDEERADDGYVWNGTKAFSHRPEIRAGWERFMGSIAGNMDHRRYELATLAAATALKSSYCSLAHGQVLADKFYTAEEVAALVDEPPNNPVDEAVMAFARKVALGADTVTQADVDGLKAVGLTDADVLDVALAAAARAFFSKTLDATGTQPDSVFNNLPDTLRTALTVGRPIYSG